MKNTVEEKNKTTWENYIESRPKLIFRKNQLNPKTKFLCQCKCGYVFDYRYRIKYDINSQYVPCQGKCPNCGGSSFTFIEEGYGIYPIKWNFL